MHARTVAFAIAVLVAAALGVIAVFAGTFESARVCDGQVLLVATHRLVQAAAVGQPPARPAPVLVPVAGYVSTRRAFIYRQRKVFGLALARTAQTASCVGCAVQMLTLCARKLVFTIASFVGGGTFEVLRGSARGLVLARRNCGRRKCKVLPLCTLAGVWFARPFHCLPVGRVEVLAVFGLLAGRVLQALVAVAGALRRSRRGRLRPTGPRAVGTPGALQLVAYLARPSFHIIVLCAIGGTARFSAVPLG